MKSVCSIKEKIVNSRMPLVCVPLSGRDIDELKSELEKAAACLPDLIEWRADSMENPACAESVLKTAGIIRSLTDIPLLFTLRTKSEGGAFRGSRKEWETICREIIRTGNFEMIDLELAAGENQLSGMIEAAHRNRMTVIVSSHDFKKTPPEKEMLRRMRAMIESGADIPKLAVMPEISEDVLALLKTAAQVHREAGVPVIAVSMGKTGILSRAAGGLFGSCITFAAAGRSSAPGQIPAETLRMMMRELY